MDYMLQSRHRMAEWIRKQETHFRSKETQRLKVKGWKKKLHGIWGGGEKNTTRIEILTPDKTDFKTKAVKRDKEGSRNST